MKKLRVGVVGVGHIGSNHARLYAEIPSAEFTAVYDVEPFRSSTIASKFGAAAAKSLDDFISMVDAASVATPTSTHYDVARALLAKGKHVLIEKPITDNTSQSLLIWLPLTLSSCKWGTSNDSIQSWARSKNI
jgi:predicted dehydrogenase